MRALLAGLAALAMLFVMSFVMQQDVLVPAASDVVILAVADLDVPTAALGGVVVTQTDALTGADVITLGRAKWGYGAHTARQLVAFMLNIGKMDQTTSSGYFNYTVDHADGALTVTAADLNGQEAGWTPGAHTERLHRLGSPLITT